VRASNRETSAKIRIQGSDEKATAITCVFLDIGGVLLTDGWGHD
jgi:hypothetical protein